MWFRFHTELAKCCCFVSEFSNFTQKCARQKQLLRTRRERGGASHTSLTYNLVCSLCSLKELFFFVWQFTIIIGICSFEHYPFLGIALMTRPVTCLVGIHNYVVYHWLHGIASKRSLSPSLLRYTYVH